MNDAGNAKQKIVERIKDSSNILVTVSTNPSVDELSAALGLTAMLNKVKKHATAVVSGDIPPAIEFLEPGKTFENTVDSLRDFIIALDKEKADHLRYKVEGDVVKIFITPYRTTIDENDLEFSQGDYNVELVLALGVKDKEHLDSALAAHGRILHDATVATLGVGSEKSKLGSIDWHDENASCLSEMLVSLSEALKTDKPVLDEQIATAFLTGIVAATDRFSNEHTTSRVMTMAAQLMAAGANQQVIAAKLEEAHEINSRNTPNDDVDSAQDDDTENSDGTVNLSEGESTKLDRSEKAETKKEETEVDGSLHISHEKQGDLDAVRESVTKDERQAAKDAVEARLKEQQDATVEGAQNEAAQSAEDELAAQLKSVAPATASTVPTVEDLRKDVAEASAEVEKAAEEPVTGELPPVQPPSESKPLQGAVHHTEWKTPATPTFGGTLNATTEQAAEDKRREEEADRNRSILSHKSEYVGDSQPTYQSPLNAASDTPSDPPMVDPFNEETLKGAEGVSTSTRGKDLSPLDSGSSLAQAAQPTLEEIDRAHRAPKPDPADARAAVDEALQSASQVPPATPFDTGSVVPPPPMPDFSNLPPLPTDSPESELPPEQLGDIFTQDGPPPPPPSQEPPAPGQFKIPGQ
jgi:hypothetical protein